MKKIYSILVSDNELIITCDNNHPAWGDKNFGRVCESFSTKKAAEEYVENELFCGDEIEESEDHSQCQYDYACGYVD